MPSNWDSENAAALEALQRGDVEPLIALLEDTARPMHPELRCWLVAMLRGDSQTRWWLECKRHPGFPKPDEGALAVRDIVIGHRIHELWDSGCTITESKGRAAQEYNRESRTIDDAWTSYRRLYFRLKNEGEGLSPDLRRLRAQKSQP